MDDASLDDFLSDGDEADPGDDPAAADPSPDTTPDAEDDGGDAPTVDAADVDPAVSTYAWSDDDATCDACGEPVERRWRDGDQLVCSDCKDW